MSESATGVNDSRVVWKLFMVIPAEGCLVTKVGVGCWIGWIVCSIGVDKDDGGGVSCKWGMNRSNGQVGIYWGIKGFIFFTFA